MRCLLLFFLFCTFCSDNLYALDWLEGQKEVSENNTAILSAKNLLKSSQYQEKAARSGFLPKVSGTAGTNYGTSSVSDVKERTNTLSISASENLFSGYSDSSKLSQAQFTREGQEANLRSTLAQVSYEYKAAFMSLLFAQKYVELTNDIINRRKANLRLVELRFESGRENIGSLHLSKAYLAQAKYDHLVAINALTTGQTTLAKVLGRNDDDGIVVNGTVPVSNPDNLNLNFNELTLLTPEYQKAYTEEKVALASLDLSKSNFYPSLNLTQAGYRSNRDAGPYSNSWSIGAMIALPLFNGGSDYYTSKSSNELYRSSVMKKKITQDAVMVKLKDAFGKFQEAILKLEVDQAFVQAGNTRERIAKEKYNNGLLTFDEWDIIENDLINRLKNLVQSERDRVVAEAYWEQVQGKGVFHE